MVTVTLCLVGAAAYVIDEGARELAADVKLAMKRADLSVDFVARVIGVPRPKLSDQLNAVTPFTSFWRFTAREIRDSDFWPELLELRARRLDRALVKSDLARLVMRVEQLVGAEPKRMAKAALAPVHGRSVELPLVAPVRGARRVPLMARSIVLGALVALTLALSTACVTRHSAGAHGLDVMSDACASLDPDGWLYWLMGCGKDSAGGGGSGAGH